MMCEFCEDACRFNAITGMEVSGDHKAHIHSSACYGCGLCRTTCPADALSMKGRK